MSILLLIFLLFKICVRILLLNSCGERMIFGCIILILFRFLLLLMVRIVLILLFIFFVESIINVLFVLLLFSVRMVW